MDAYLDGTQASVPRAVLDDVASGALSLLDLVRQLGGPLTSEDDAQRARAVRLLSEVVQHLTAQADDHTHAQLTRQVLRTLSVFFSSKITDAVAVGDAVARAHNDATLVPASSAREAVQADEARAMRADGMLVDCLRALQALTSVGFGAGAPSGAPALGAEEARGIARAVLALELRKYPQPLRHLVCELVDALVARYRSALRAMRTAPEAPDGSAFVQSYAQLVAGEKDPRNLLVLFGIARVLLLEFPMAPAEAEAMYNVLFCYFPISFRPPPDDPYRISPETLKQALRACLSASPALAPLGYPVLLEKLSASGGTSKLDTLDTLAACLPVYGAAAAAAHAQDMWAYLKLDILQPTEDVAAEHAQATLTALVRVLYEQRPPEGLGVEMLDDCLQEMATPGKALATLSLKIVQSMVEAHTSTAQYAVQRMLTQLLAQWPDADADEARALLALLAALLDMLEKTYSTGARTYDGDGRPLDAFHDALLGAFTSQVATGCEAGLQGAVRLLVCPGLLSADEQRYVTQCVQAALLRDELRATALHGLERLLATHRALIASETVPFLLRELPTSLDGVPPRARLALAALARLCVPVDLFNEFLVRMWALLAAVAEGPADAAHVGYASAILATLQVALERKCEEAHTDVPRYAASLPMRLVAWLQTPSAVVRAAPVQQLASDVMVLLVSRLDAAAAQALLESVRRERLWLSDDAPDDDVPLLAPCAAVLVALPRGVDVPGAAWLRRALAYVQAPHDALSQRSVCLIACALANKSVAPDAELRATLDAFWAALPSLPQPPRAACLAMWLWIARGWMARGDAYGTHMLERLRTDMLAEPALGVHAAGALQVLASRDAVVSKAHHFQVRMLYQQRALEGLLRDLVAAYRAADDAAARTTCLVAVATILPALPPSTLHTQATSLLPLLVHTLSIDDARARAAAARALATTVTQDGADPAWTSALEAHLPAMLRHLLAHVAPRPPGPASSRAAMCELLRALATGLPPEVLLPHRREVVRGLAQLGAGLSDARRPVRAAAVDARAAWCRLEEPSSST